MAVLSDPNALLLDTNALIRLVGKEPLSQAAVTAVRDALRNGTVFVSAITAWELGLLATRSKTAAIFHLPIAIWFAEATRGMTQLDLGADIALASTQLPELDHRDPADRLLIATARAYDLTLVTRDDEILDYAARGHVKALAC